MRKKMFSGNATNLFLSIMVLGFILFLTIGTIAIFAIFAVQFLALIFSDKLILGSGNVRPDKNRQEVAVIRIASTPETEKVLMQMEDRLNKSIKEQLKRAISEDTASEEEKRSKILDILVQHGVPCSLDDVEIVIRNPYSIVESTAQKFQLPVPKVSIMNSTVDNAAATGVSHGRSSILITAGALEDLDDNELTSVVGHELGHVKGRDPLILFSVTLVVYIGGFYLWLPVLLYLGFFYFILAFALTYAVGKVLETRADTQSMIVLGTPNVLASALTSIGFRRLYFERYSRRYRVLDWLSFDPHPPIYFRVNRLASYAARGAKVKHALIVSVRDCAVGFFQSLVR